MFEELEEKKDSKLWPIILGIISIILFVFFFAKSDFQVLYFQALKSSPILFLYTMLFFVFFLLEIATFRCCINEELKGFKGFFGFSLIVMLLIHVIWIVEIYQIVNAFQKINEALETWNDLR
jgi:hypothetical protein